MFVNVLVARVRSNEMWPRLAGKYADQVYAIGVDFAVVVLFAEKSATLRVLEAARRVGVGSRFVWLGSDSWPDRRDAVVAEDTTVLEGALAVQPLYAPLAGFDEYFTGLRLDHGRNNPWFREFWRIYHGCTDDETGENVGEVS